MLATDPLTLPDIAALCRAVDEGDDEALPALADALEELGDPRAAGLRQRLYWLAPLRMEWRKASGTRPRRSHSEVHANVFDRLPPHDGTGRKGATVLHYSTRSAAYLALAEALI